LVESRKDIRMKTKVPLMLVAVLLWHVAGPTRTSEPARAAPPPDALRAYEIGAQAYVYAYPMVLMEITRRVSTNVPAPQGSFAPMNQFAHLRAFPDHTFREVVRPNADTLYSIAWLDLSGEPMVLSVPDTGGRYYLLPMLDMWTDVFAAPGSRTSGTEAADFAIVGPRFQGSLPEGVEPVRCPTNVTWIIGRTQTNGAPDYENVHRIQDGFKLTPLSRWGKPYAPPAKSPVDPDLDTKTPPPAQVARMDARTFFELFASLVKDNPPHEVDWPIVAQLRRIGIVPGRDLDFSKLDVEIQEALQRAVTDAQQMIADRGDRQGEFVHGWSISRELMGTYGTTYLQRAYVALIGLGANVAEDAVYPMSFVDAEGKPYDGSHPYRIHFDRDQLPPVNAFWSIAMYEADGYFVDNPIRRYSIGDRDPLQFNRDGSLDLYLQHESPGKSRQSNWLPAPEGDFNLVFRMYWPKIDVLNGAWSPPPVERVDGPPAEDAGAASPLDELDWTVGTWVDQGEDSTITTTCSWAKNGKFLIRSFAISVEGDVTLEGTQVVGWDPSAGRIRSWTFDSEGGFGEGYWTRDGNRWLVKTSFVLASGEKASAVNVITCVDEDTLRWQSTDREVGGELLPNIPEVTVVRQKP
jgi:hypothetical protein